MKRVLLSLGMIFCWASVSSQGTITTSPPLVNNNGQSGITFAYTSSTATNITSINVLFNSGVSSADVWVRQGGVSGPPNISAAGGWTRVVTAGTVTGANGTALAPIDFGGIKIAVPGGGRIGVHISAGLSYQTGTAADQVIYTDGPATVDVSDSVAYGGGPPSPTFNPRRFLGSVTYELGVIGNCTPFTNFAIDSISATAAKVSWSPGAGNTGYYLEYGTAGFTPGSGTKITGSYPAQDSIEILTGLTANTNYDVYFGEFCNSGMDTVFFPAPQGFTTTKLCAPVTNLKADSIYSNSVDLSWNYAGTANSFTIIYGPPGFTPSGSSNTATASGSPYTLTGLATITDYDIYVYADCGAVNGISDTVGPLSIQTICAPFTAPYTNGFENDVNLATPLCFDVVNTTTSGWVRVSNSTSTFTGPANTGVNFLQFRSGNTTGDTLAAISPQFSDMTAGDKQIGFFAKKQDPNDANFLIIGSSPNANSVSAYTPLDTIMLTGNYVEYIVPITTANGYNGTDQYLVFAHSTSATFDYIMIDDLSYEVIPACPKILAPTILCLTDSSATFNITSNGSSFEVEFGPAGFAQGTGCQGSFTSTTFTIDNNTDASCSSQLITGTDYDIYIRNNCTASSNGTSVWQGPITFTTQCSLTAPYSTGFEGSTVNEPEPCWTERLVGPATSAFASVYQFGTVFAGSQHLRLANSSNGGANDTTMAVTPGFSDLPMMDKQIKFFAKRSFNAPGSIIVGTLSNPSCYSTFSPVDTVNFMGADVQFTVLFDAASGYNGTDEFIGLLHGGTSTFETYYIDEFEYLTIPSCVPTNVFDITTELVTNDSAFFSWLPGAGVSHTIEIGLQGYTQGTGAIGSASVSDTFGGIGGLSANTYYDFYIQDSCSDGSLSPLVGPITILTGCTPPASPTVLPYTEGFESLSGQIDSNANICGSNLEYRQEPGGRLRFNAGTAYYNNGSAAATLDRQSFGSVATSNYLTMNLNLSNYTTTAGIELSFFYMHHAQEVYDDNRVWARGESSDPWVEIYDLDDNQGAAGQYNEVKNIDIVNPLAAAGQTVSSTTQIRFGQAGTSNSNFSPNFSDGYTFDDILLEAVTCPTPSGLSLSSLTDSSATLKWNASGSANNTQIWFGPVGFYQGTTTASNAGARSFVSGDSLLVDTLSSDMCYEFVVRYVCGPGDSSIWAGPFDFCTPCDPITAPYFENWDGLPTGGDLGCFSKIQDPSITSAFQGIIVTTNGNPRSTPNQLEFDNGNTMSPLILVSPPTTDMTAGDKRVTFYARQSFAGTPVGQLVVGTMALPNDASTFHPLDTFDLGGTAPSARYVSNITTANGYNGTDNYFAVSHGLNSTFDTHYLDDLTYETIPTCPEVNSASLETISTDSVSATVTFQPFSGSSGNFQIEVGTGMLGDPNHTRLIVTNDTATIPNLMDGTSYCFWVREICATGDTSIWIGPSCFFTECLSISAPYTENWDNLPTGNFLGCFRSIEDPVLQPSLFQGVNVVVGGTFQGPLSPPNLVELDNGNTSTPLLLISPKTNDMTAGDKRVRFYARTTTTLSTTLRVGTMSDPSDASTFKPLDTVQLTNANPVSEYIVNLDAANGYNGTDQYFAFAHGQDGTFRTIYVDDVNYEKIPACLRPSNPGVRQIGVTSAVLYWTPASTSATNWVVEYGPCGFALGTGIQIGATNDTIALSNLIQNTRYGFRVAEICPGGLDTSIFETEVCFSTNCLAKSAPYVEPFTNNTIGHFDGQDNCWTFSSNNPGTTSNGGYSWEVRNSVQTTSGSTTGPDRDNTLFPAIGGTFITADVSGSSTAGPDSTLITSPIIDISGLTNPEFSYFYHRFGTRLADLHVDIYDGSKWIRSVDSYTNQTGPQTSHADAWSQAVISLSPYIGTTNLQVRFRSVTNGCCPGDNAIDDIRISDAPGCPSVSNINVTSAATAAAISFDTSGTGSTNFLIEYGAAGFTPGNGTMLSVTSGLASIPNLGNNLCVEAYVSNICVNGDTNLFQGPIVVCPDEVPCDDFDQYAVGGNFDQSALFHPWDGGGAAAWGDAEFSSTRSQSSPNSLLITDQGTTGASDVVVVFDTISAGAWEVSWDMFVESNSGAYFNVQQNHTLTAGGNTFGGEIYFQDNGTAQLQYGTGSNVVGTFTYSQNQWISISVIIDLTNDTTWYEYNGTSTGLGYKYSVVNPAAPLQFNGIDFFTGALGTATYNVEFYVDNFCITPFSQGSCPAPTGLMATTNIGCDSIEVSWNSGSGGSFLIYSDMAFPPNVDTTVIVSSPYTITGLAPGISYDVVVFDTCGSDTSAASSIISATTASGPLPVASFTANATSSTSGSQTFAFDASASTGGVSYDWDFDDGNNGTGVTTTNVYNAPNNSYDVTLTVTNGCGTDDTTITINTNIGLSELPLAQSLELFPNPSEGVFNVSFEMEQRGEITIEVMDAAGAQVFSEKLEDYQGEYSGKVDLTGEAKGIYLLRIWNGDGAVTRRLSKQ